MLEERIKEIEERVLCRSGEYWREHKDLLKDTLRVLYRFLKQCHCEGCHNHKAEDIVRNLPECPAKALLVTYVYQMECHSFSLEEDIEFIKKMFDRKILAATGNDAEQFCYVLTKDCIFSAVNAHLGWTVYHAEHGNSAGFYEEPKEVIVEGIINYLTSLFCYEDGMEVEQYLFEVWRQDEKEDCENLSEALKESLEKIQQSKEYIERRKTELLEFKEKIPLPLSEDRMYGFKVLSAKIRRMQDYDLMDMACACSNEAYAALCLLVDAEAFCRLMSVMSMRLRDLLLTIEIPEIYEKCLEAPDAVENILINEIKLIPQLEGLIKLHWVSIEDLA